MKRIAFVLSSFLLFGLAHAASFDCAKASTKVEHIICGSPDISKLDDELSHSYKAALQNQGQADQIKQTQRQWIKERNGCADARCVKKTYQNRINALSNKQNVTGVHAANLQPSVRDIFMRAAHKVALLTSIPVYVPVSIQSLDKYAKDGCTFEMADRGSFNISLHGRVKEYGKTEPLPCEGSDASLLAIIHGDIKPMPNLSNTGAQRVRLKSGSVAWFSPISCGGSCSPATLYWQTPKASYWLQLKLASDIPVAQQRKELLNTVNSLEVVPNGH